MIKKILIIISIPLIILLIAAFSLFLKPELVINQKNLEWALDRWSPFEQTIKVFEFSHIRHSFLNREIEIHLEDLHLKNNDQPNFTIHLKEMDFSFRLFWKSGWQVESRSINSIIFERIFVSLPTASDDQSEDKKLDPIHLAKNYSLLWMKVIPDFDLIVRQLEIEHQNKNYALPLMVKKTKTSLESIIHEFQLNASPETVSFKIDRPVQLWSLLDPKDISDALAKKWQELELSISLELQKNQHPLLINLDVWGASAQLEALIPDTIDFSQTNELLENIFPTLIIQAEHPHFIETLLPFITAKNNKKAEQIIEKQSIKAKIHSRFQGQKSSVGEISFDLKSQIDLEVSTLELELQHSTQAALNTEAVLKADKGLLSSVLLGTQVELTIDQLYKKWEKLEGKLLQLPAPLNSLDGDLLLKLGFQKGADGFIEASVDANFDLEGHQQYLILKTSTLLALDKEALTPIGPLQTQVQLERVNLRLPRWKAQVNTPQFVPDSRIILPSQKKIPKKQKDDNSQGIEIDLHLTTDKKQPMTIGTNLLKEPVRLLFDIKIEKGVIKEGHIDVLPLELEVFRRKIVVNSLRVEFLSPALPVLKAKISFHLPQYLITLNLEGTTDQLRHHFSSTPPLPQSDIYAVLLFGRPMTDLSEGDRAASNQTQQMLSDGILSLSVLYFLSGGPIESIGFNPDTGSVSAQVGISKESSLTLSTSASGEKSASVRRSLGRGWYIDTSVQNNNQMPHGAQQDYGVLLEKIMAY